MDNKHGTSFTITSVDDGRTLRLAHLEVKVTLPNQRIISTRLGIGA